MTVIFKNFDIESLIQRIRENAVLNNVIKFIKSNRILVKFASICLVGIFALIISVASVGITVGFNVKYSGKVIATVNDTSVFESAKDIAVKNVEGEAVDKAIAVPKFSLTITVTDKLANAVKLADAIVENTDEFVMGSALVVNGKTVVCVESEDLSQLLEARRTAFYVSGAENTASFVDNVEIKESYYLKSDISDFDDAKEAVNKLQVKTVSIAVNEINVPFTTKRVYTNSEYVGYSKVTTAGVNGVTKETTVTESINGELCGEAQVSKEVLVEPVQQVVTYGTAKKASSRSNKVSSGFIFPINARYKVSSYYGDGRGHKGVDICADKGVAIFAVAGGTVTYSGYDSDFGYNVIIDHGNGIKTRYAHASALCVKKGATVAQGDMIATVGSTGYSTGNHLHFEVIVNGVRVNPAPYIGL